MLFNSYPFLLAFLPLALAGFVLFGRLGPGAGCLWLTAASLIFYVGNGLAFTALLLASATVNYAIGTALGKRAQAATPTRWLLRAGVAGNLLLLGWFKYLFFLAGLFDLASPALHVALPIGISFFTFTQIAYLIDAASGKAEPTGPVAYLLFVTWFPHLVAGPLLHHISTIPQFRDPRTFRLRADSVAIGLTVFCIGLFKKVVLADEIAPTADALFTPEAAAAAGLAVSWTGTLAYTMQIYFDFSGYSDMAIGLSRLFNIHLPANFDSPYQARSIIEFWRRWHMSLSAFLRDYVYIPLGGNRGGAWHQARNVALTMLLAGIWHGAGWTFIAWGAWHATLLVIAHAWRGSAIRGGWPLTLLAVILGWVVFRAPDIATAATVYAGMAGLHGLGALPDARALILIAAMAGIALILPNTRQLMANETLVLPMRTAAPALLPSRWRPTPYWAAACLAMLTAALLQMTRVSPFLYYQF